MKSIFNFLAALPALIIMLGGASCHSLSSKKETGPAPVDSLHEKPWHTTTSPLPGVKGYPDSTSVADTTGIYDNDTTN